MTIEPLHLAALALLGLGLYLNRAAILARLNPPAAPAPLPAPTVRLVDPAPAPAAAPAPPLAISTAELLALVHHQTEAEALRKAHEDAALAITATKARAKAAGLPWVGLPPQTPPNPTGVEPPKG